jgi:hypothetical protein
MCAGVTIQQVQADIDKAESALAAQGKDFEDPV